MSLKNYCYSKTINSYLTDTAGDDILTRLTQCPEIQSYCITFFPVVSGVIDPTGCQQVFLKLSEKKVEDLKDFFRRVNEDKNTKIKIFMEKFEIDV